MGSLIQAVIQHNLSSKEILSLSEALDDVRYIDNDSNKLQWTVPNIDTVFLEEYWQKPPEDFMKTPWGIEDLPLLENEKLSLHFSKYNLTSFGTLLRREAYKNNPVFKSEFDSLAKSIALQMKAVDIIIIEDWYYDHDFDFNDKLTIDIIRQGVTNKNLPFYEIDLNVFFPPLGGKGATTTLYPPPVAQT